MRSRMLRSCADCGLITAVIGRQIGANNPATGKLQSEVKLTLAAACSFGFILLREPLPLAECLQARTVYSQMEGNGSALPHHRSDDQNACAALQRGIIRRSYIQPHELGDGTHKPQCLAQSEPIRRAQAQA